MDLEHRNYLMARKLASLGLDERTFSLPLGTVAELAEVAQREQTTVARLCTTVVAIEILELEPTLVPFTDVQRALLPLDVWADGLVTEGIVHIVLPPAYTAVVVRRAWERSWTEWEALVKLLLVGLNKHHNLILPPTMDVLDGASLCERLINAILCRYIDRDADVATIAEREGGLSIRVYRVDTVVYEYTYRRVHEHIMKNIGYRLEILAAAQASSNPNRYSILYEEQNYEVHFAVTDRLIRLTVVPVEADI